MILGGLMLSTLTASLYFHSGDQYAILIAALITSGSGFLLYLIKRDSSVIRKREGYLVVSLGWIVISLFGMLPYLINGAIPNITDAFFETVSGFTTTGASVLNNIEEMPEGLLLWRSMTQWIGGMGIIVMTIAILPILGIGGMELFVAEAPGPTSDKIHPRITETAKRLWAVYLTLTVLEAILLMAGGMTFYDAINHAFTTMATGGFSTKNNSIAYYDSAYLQYIIILFMFLAGTNFTLNYFLINLTPGKLWNNQEFKAYLLICVSLTVAIGTYLYLNNLDTLQPEKCFRDALFQTVSLITTTGYVTADYTSWAPFLTVVFFLMMFLGGSAGSTGGGVKIVRHLALAKNSLLEFKRIIHPRAVIPVKINGRIVPQKIITNIMVFILIYLIVFAFGSVVMSAFGLDFDTALGSVATSLGNIGPGIGSVGPVDNFYSIPTGGKWFLTILMLIGRLELYTMLSLLMPWFWKTS